MALEPRFEDVRRYAEQAWRSVQDRSPHGPSTPALAQLVQRLMQCLGVPWDPLVLREERSRGEPQHGTWDSVLTPHSQGGLVLALGVESVTSAAAASLRELAQQLAPRGGSVRLYSLDDSAPVSIEGIELLSLRLRGLPPELAVLLERHLSGMQVETFRLAVDLGMAVPLMDGLDELRLEGQPYEKALQKLVTAFQGAQARMVISSRKTVFRTAEQLHQVRSRVSQRRICAT